MLIKKFENLIYDKDYYDEVTNLISIINSSGIYDLRSKMKLYTSTCYSYKNYLSVNISDSECVFEIENTDSYKYKLNKFIKSDEFQDSLDEDFIYSFILDIGYSIRKSNNNKSENVLVYNNVDALPDSDGDSAYAIDDQSIEYDFNLMSSIRKIYYDATKSGWKVYKFMGNYIFIKK